MENNYLIKKLNSCLDFEIKTDESKDLFTIIDNRYGQLKLIQIATNWFSEIEKQEFDNIKKYSFFIFYFINTDTAYVIERDVMNSLLPNLMVRKSNSYVLNEQELRLRTNGVLTIVNYVSTNPISTKRNVIPTELNNYKELLEICLYQTVYNDYSPYDRYIYTNKNKLFISIFQTDYLSSEIMLSKDDCLRIKNKKYLVFCFYKAATLCVIEPLEFFNLISGSKYSVFINNNEYKRITLDLFLDNDFSEFKLLENIFNDPKLINKKWENVKAKEVDIIPSHFFNDIDYNKAQTLMKTNKVKEKIKYGEIGEELALEYYKSIKKLEIIDVRNDPYYMNIDVDFILKNNEKIDLLEVKTKIRKGDNIFFTLWQNTERTKPGYVLKTKADFIFLYSLQTNSAIVCHFPTLKRVLLNKKYKFKEVVTKKVHSNGIGLLVPVSKMLNNPKLYGIVEILNFSNDDSLEV